MDSTVAKGVPRNFRSIESKISTHTYTHSHVHTTKVARKGIALPKSTYYSLERLQKFSARAQSAMEYL
ncbi:MAG: hypothetical protein QXK65_03200, partial [Candidatus Micrarchaeaceae archaeon]